MGRIAGHGFGLAVLVGAGLLRAEPAPPSTARLEYTRGRGAERCPDAAAVQSAVTARLGYDPFRTDAPRTVTARVRRGAGALRGDVELHGADGAVTGARHLSAAGNDCSELVAAMALAISLAIDPQSLLRPAMPSSPAPLLPAAPPPTPSRPTPPASRPVPEIAPKGAPPLLSPLLAPRPQPALRLEAPRGSTDGALAWRFGLGGVLTAGATPGLGAGGTAQAGIRWRALSVALEGRADLPASLRAEGGGAVAASLVTVTLVPCFHAGLVLGCGLGSLGSLRGSGSGVLHPRNDATPFGAIGLRLGVEIPLQGALAFAFHGDLAATVTRTTLNLDDRAVWSTPPVSAALGAGLVAHFP